MRRIGINLHAKRGPELAAYLKKIKELGFDGVLSGGARTRRSLARFGGRIIIPFVCFFVMMLTSFMPLIIILMMNSHVL